jgi:hypothetical protein
MPFFNEKISAAEDIAKFKSLRFVNPVTSKPIDPYRWTIDRSQDMYLVCLGGQGSELSEIPEFYAFVRQGKIISRFEGFSKAEGSAKVGITQWRRITKLEIPKILISESELILKLIRESLHAFGDGLGVEDVIAVYIDLPTPKFI